MPTCAVFSVAVAGWCEVRVNGNRTDPINYYKDKTLYARANGKTVLLSH